APASPTEVCERTRRDGGSVFPALANTGDPNGPRGLSANEITGALIPIMARSEMLQPKAGYIDARPLPPTRRNSLATHGRTIHVGHVDGLLLPRTDSCAAAIAFYSITSSTRSRKSRLMVKPSACAVFRLTTSSSLLGCSIGSW